MHSVESVASHELAVDQADEIIDTSNGQPFDVDRFHAMKYGDRAVTRQFARTLIEQVVDARPRIIEDERPPRLVVPYQVIPPTPFYLSRYALEVVNAERDRRSLPPGSIMRIDKSRTQTTNYAAMSARERQIECDSIDYFLAPEEDPNEQNQILILDDVRVTGTVIQHLIDVFRDRDPNDIMLGFVATIDPDLANERPQLEDRINNTAAATIEAILPSILSDNFDLNIRALKMILSTDRQRLIPFLEQCPPWLVEKMLFDTLLSGKDFVRYHRIGYECLNAVNKGGETDNIRPLLIAHKGDALHHDENTNDGVTSAFDRGADGVEIDVQAIEGRLVAVHDYMYDPSREYDLVEDILYQNTNRGKFQLDIKAQDLAFLPHLKELLTQYVTEDIELSTNVWPIIPALKEALPGHKIGIIFQPFEFTEWMPETFVTSRVINYMTLMGGHIAHLPYPVVLKNPGVVAACHELDIKIQSHIPEMDVDKARSIYQQLGILGVDQCTSTNINFIGLMKSEKTID